MVLCHEKSGGIASSTFDCNHIPQGFNSKGQATF